jgi:hypothetical protein
MIPFPNSALRKQQLLAVQGLGTLPAHQCNLLNSPFKRQRSATKALQIFAIRFFDLPDSKGLRSLQNRGSFPSNQLKQRNLCMRGVRRGFAARLFGLPCPS